MHESLNTRPRMRPSQTSTDGGCPNCDGTDVTLFYRGGSVPIHSCVMLDNHKTAVDYPHGELLLGMCSRCGFITNIAYDSQTQENVHNYEDQQSFSPHFRRYQSDLIARLIRDHDLQNKDVIEIGCGKGDFLVELCRTGVNRGVGIDPRCVPRNIREPHCNTQFFAESLNKAHTRFPCDFICCLHTLEHIHSTHHFIRLVRDVIGERNNVLVFFLVPDVERILRERAFWDVYYEHCSYFSLGSLARLFRKNCFDVIELTQDFGNQYLLVVARPTNKATMARAQEEENVQTAMQYVEKFDVDIQDRIEKWRFKISLLRNKGKRIAVWGSSSKCVAFLSALRADNAIDAIVDINPHRHGKFLPGSGKQISHPNVLRDLHPDAVFVMNPIYCEEIEQQLRRMRITTELIPL